MIHESLNATYIKSWLNEALLYYPDYSLHPPPPPHPWAPRQALMVDRWK